MEAQLGFNNTKYVYFLGQPYFDEDTVVKNIEATVGNGDLDYELQKLVKRKLGRNKSDELCASHDLAALSEPAFDLNRSQLKNQMIREVGNLGIGKENQKQEKGQASKGRKSSKISAEPGLMRKVGKK